MNPDHCVFSGFGGGNCVGQLLSAVLQPSSMGWNQTQWVWPWIRRMVSLYLSLLLQVWRLRKHKRKLILQLQMELCLQLICCPVMLNWNIFASIAGDLRTTWVWSRWLSISLMNHGAGTNLLPSSETTNTIYHLKDVIMRVYHDKQ